MTATERTKALLEQWEDEVPQFPPWPLSVRRGLNALHQHIVRAIDEAVDEALNGGAPGSFMPESQVGQLRHELEWMQTSISLGTVHLIRLLGQKLLDDRATYQSLLRDMAADEKMEIYRAGYQKAKEEVAKEINDVYKHTTTT